MQIGYCTNVHAGPDLKSTQANLLQYAAKVKERFSPNEPMGIGLWLAADDNAEATLIASFDMASQYFRGEVAWMPDS